jgi:hypothetical protein
MNKEEVSQRIRLNGKPLPLEKFAWDEQTKTFSCVLDDLVIDFGEIQGCKFKTGSNCTFKTGPDCTFDTGFFCTFSTHAGCTFRTGSDCTFYTGSSCMFDTGSSCTFDTGPNCTFNTGPNCTFGTGPICTFNTGPNCTFDTGCRCTFNGLSAPLPRFNGSQHPLELLPDGQVKSGHIIKPLSWWSDNIASHAEEQAYTPDQVREYVTYIRMIELFVSMQNDS